MMLNDTWDSEYKSLQSLIKKGKDIDAIIGLALKLHAEVHFAACSDLYLPTICDEIWKDAPDEYFFYMPVKKHLTAAWCFWHLYRIEDIVSNILILGGTQQFDKIWKERIHSGITDTANAQSYKEVVQMSRRIDHKALKEYCIAVGKNTREVIKGMTMETLKEKPLSQSLNRLEPEGILVEDKHSIWLKDYWGGLTFGGLICTPFLRHHTMHLPGCLAIKKIMQERAHDSGQR